MLSEKGVYQSINLEKFHVSGQKSEILHFNKLLLAKKVLKSFEKVTCSFKDGMRNLVNFHPTTQKSENFTLMGTFCPKYKGLT